MRWIVERLGVPQRAIRQIKTDCLVLQPAKKLIPKLMTLGDIRHCDLANLVQTYMSTEAGQKRLDEGIQMARSKDESLIYRWTRGPDVKWLQGYYREPELDVATPTLVSPWLDLCEEEAKEAARSQGLLVCGCPGVGKSYWARELVAQLRADGKVVNCIAKTHLACKNFQMGCETADHWVMKRVQNGDCASVQYLVVEEASQNQCAAVGRPMRCQAAWADHHLLGRLWAIRSDSTALGWYTSGTTCSAEFCNAEGALWR